MIRKALPGDIIEIMSIVRDSRAIMQASGNFQWDENYPLEEDFKRDISGQNLYIIEENGEVAGFACINDHVPREYGMANWNKTGAALVIHRMAVSPRFRGLGLAGKLLDFAWELAQKTGAASLRTDTFSGNIPMNSLFLKHGFSKTGEVELESKKQQPFYCYEKIGE